MGDLGEGERLAGCSFLYKGFGPDELCFSVLVGMSFPAVGR